MSEKRTVDGAQTLEDGMNEYVITTQAELDALPESFDVWTLIRIQNTTGRIILWFRRDNSSVEAWGNSSVEAWDNSSVVARENSSVVARDNSSVVARGNSSVVARGNSSVVARGNSSVEARENSSVVARENSSVVAWDNSSVVARGNSSVVAWGNSSVEARENSSVEARDNSSVEARENSSVVAWDNSSVEAWDNSSVDAWDNSSVMAWENSSVEAWDNSSVEARENSSVEARGNSSVEAWDNSSVEAWDNSSVVARGNSFARILSGSVKASGKQYSIIVLQDCAQKVEAADTCTVQLTKTVFWDKESFLAYYKLMPDADGFVRMSKIVRDDLFDHYTGQVKYEGEVVCPDWDGDIGRECGGGLHVSATEKLARRFYSTGKALVVKVHVDDFVVHPMHIDKVRCRRLVVES